MSNLLNKQKIARLTNYYSDDLIDMACVGAARNAVQEAANRINNTTLAVEIGVMAKRLEEIRQHYGEQAEIQRQSIIEMVGEDRS